MEQAVRFVTKRSLNAGTPSSRHAPPSLQRSPRYDLHRALGNQGMQRVRSGLVQAKLTVNDPNDAYEHEADRVADEVLRMPEPGGRSLGASSALPRIQRLCSHCEEEMQRKAPMEDDEPVVQAKREDVALEEGAAAITPYVEGLAGRGEPLAPETRAFFEPRFGADFSAVRIHTGAEAHRSAEQ